MQAWPLAECGAPTRQAPGSEQRRDDRDEGQLRGAERDAHDVHQPQGGGIEIDIGGRQRRAATQRSTCWLTNAASWAMRNGMPATSMGRTRSRSAGAASVRCAFGWQPGERVAPQAAPGGDHRRYEAGAGAHRPRGRAGRGHQDENEESAGDEALRFRPLVRFATRYSPADGGGRRRASAGRHEGQRRRSATVAADASSTTSATATVSARATGMTTARDHAPTRTMRRASSSRPCARARQVTERASDQAAGDRQAAPMATVVATANPPKSSSSRLGQHHGHQSRSPEARESPEDVPTRPVRRAVAHSLRAGRASTDTARVSVNSADQRRAREVDRRSDASTGSPVVPRERERTRWATITMGMTRITYRFHELVQIPIGNTGEPRSWHSSPTPTGWCPSTGRPVPWRRTAPR